MLKKMMLILAFFLPLANAETYRFVSINHLVEQQIGIIVLPQIYDKLGITITITPLPGKRAQHEAASGISDGEIMRIFTYGLENPTVHRVPTPYYHLETMVFTKKGSGVTVRTKDDLAKYSIAKVRGVKHTNNITKGLVNVTDVSNTLAMMALLNEGLVDVALTNTLDGLEAIKKLKFDDIIANEAPLAKLELFHYIHEDHKNLIPKVDQQIRKMKESGELADIVRKAEYRIIRNNTMTHNQSPIAIALNDWPSQRVLSKVIGQILKTQGYTVSYFQTTAEDQWGAFKRGLLHVQIEVWQVNNEKPLKTAISRNYVVDLGNHNAEAREDWWFPKYVKSVCPQLPDWRALNHCAHHFSDLSSNGKAIYFAGPWPFPDMTRIRALDLNVELRRLPSAAALWEKLKEAQRNHTPLIMNNWTPNWTDARVDGEFVQFPNYVSDCVNDPAWGLNKALPYDCGYPTGAWIKKVAWSGVRQWWPCIYEFLSNFKLNKSEIGEAAALVVIDGLSEEEAARRWLERFESNLPKWQKFECNSLGRNSN